jgi:hypothetical protein
MLITAIYCNIVSDVESHQQRMVSWHELSRCGAWKPEPVGRVVVLAIFKLASQHQETI